MNRTAATTVLFLVACFASPAVWSANVTGRVFLDANRNGRADSGEAGIAGCIVSEGRRLARTDENGDYRLTEVAAPAVVFVVNRPDTWPTGPWWTHLAEDDGSKSVDFALGPQQQSGPLYFVQGTDIHLRPDAVSMYPPGTASCPTRRTREATSLSASNTTRSTSSSSIGPKIGRSMCFARPGSSRLGEAWGSRSR